MKTDTQKALLAPDLVLANILARANASVFKGQKATAPIIHTALLSVQDGVQATKPFGVKDVSNFPHTEGILLHFTLKAITNSDDLHYTSSKDVPTVGELIEILTNRVKRTRALTC